MATASLVLGILGVLGGWCLFDLPCALAVVLGHLALRETRDGTRSGHEKEIAAHRSFNYALLDEEETRILGCVYIDPPERVGSDGEVSWWVVDDLAGGEVERAFDALVPRWIAADWPFQQPAIWAATSPGRTGSRCRAPRNTPGGGLSGSVISA
ncbi:hypothetical protein B0E53_00710 [Micromonospora sp. MH33]|nr:hypothetical protein B0E53_00710 [Micromonospora sp. MH33]